MKIQRYLYIALIFFVCILTISAVSAADDSASDIISANDNEPILEESINDAQTNTNDNEPKTDENINADLPISTDDNEEPILEDTTVDELDEDVNEKPTLREAEPIPSIGTDEIDYRDAKVHVNDLITEYGSGDKLLFTVTYKGVTLDHALVRIYIRYEYIDLIVGDEKPIWAYSGEDYGWDLNSGFGKLSPGRYQAVLIPTNPNNSVNIGEPAYATITITSKLVSTYDTMNLSIGDTTTVKYELDPSDTRGKISFTSNDTSIVTVDSTGKMKALKEGEATIKIVLYEDTFYYPPETSVKIKVSKRTTQLTAPDVTTTYNVNKDLVITLKDDKGKKLSGLKVTVDLNGANEYITDENGQIKVATGKLNPKTYTVKISFAGTSEYKKASKTAKVTVKKISTKLTANAKTFKFEDKTKKYTITLKDNKGKVMKNTKVSLKVNGKTYNATTNSKGVASFKLSKLTKKGNFNAVITYAGNKYYNKSTKKAKITVKAPAKNKTTWKTVAKGSKDKATVKKIQKALKNNGYYLTYKGHYLKIDGIFKGCTERSVKEFQKDKGLKVTGKVDEKTAKKLKLI